MSVSGTTQEELTGSCQIGYINLLNENINYGGTWAMHKPIQTKNMQYAPSYYDKQKFEISANLRRLNQLNGAIIPKINPGIGAPRCTFVYGGITPGGTSAYAQYIKGPATRYGPFAWSSASTFGNNVSIAPPPPTTGTSGIFDLADLPTIPINGLNSSYYTAGHAPQSLTTYNIWQLYFTQADLKKYKFSYVQDCGCLFDDPTYYGPTINQVADINGVISVQVIVPPGQQATINRIFPISQDLMYNNCYLYYPNTGLTPQQIQINASNNCGFHLYFLYNIISEYNANTNASKIVITWGTQDNSTDTTISKFMLFLFPNKPPYFQYLHPYKKNADGSRQWIEYALPIQGPSLNSGKCEVFVHYVGPAMLIGFNQEPVEWNVFNPASDHLGNQDNLFYVSVPAQSPISLTIDNMNTVFQYSPIAFDNFNLAQQYWNAILPLKSLYKCHSPRSGFGLTDINSNFQKNIFLNNTISNYQNDLTKNTGPTVYADWRSNNISTEMEIITLSGMGGTNSDQSAYYFTQWNTTVEGPAFLSVADSPGSISGYKKPPIQQNFANGAGDVAEYLTHWDVIYKSECENKSFLHGTATVTLKNLAITPKGQQILAAIEENVLSITLGGGYGEPVPFFQGLITNIETERNKTGSTTILTCEDIAWKILTDSFSTDYYSFAACRYRDSIKTCIDVAGLGNYYHLVENPSTSGYQNWQLALTARLGTMQFVTSSSMLPVLGLSPTEPIYDTLEQILKSTMNDNAYPILYWEPKNQQLILTIKQQSMDKIFFLGNVDSNNIIELTDDRDCVITDAGYKITTDNANLHAACRFWAQSPMQGIVSYTPSLIGPVPDPQSTQPRGYGNFPWVGFRKSYIEDTGTKRFKIMRSEVVGWADPFIKHFLSFAHSNINFTVYVTKPLNHWGQFLISTFVNSDNSNNTYRIEQTDPYFYISVKYTFDKPNNILTATVTGDNTSYLTSR